MIPPGQWERVASIYEAAKAQPSGERDAFLSSACGDDVALRREVESLLAEDGREGPLDTPLWNTTTPMQAGERLSIGATLGPYRIDAIIGRGGMGEVYRARDTNLGRDVALKVLPAHHADDAERLARFQREAQLLATLNHPNIATVHGLETSTAVRALVLEFVDGQTLAERLARGPMPVDEALDVSRQIAEALQAAHDKGIVHRDLKPANIKITPDSTVKVLDFGLARLVEPDGQRRTDSSMSPTITTPGMTAAGVILGTAAYMSPEQAKGKPADKRSDIWAFGCVLYEMLNGKRAFGGEDVADTLASVLKSEPDWTALPEDMPPLVRAMLEDCLKKDRRDRIGDVATVLFAVRRGMSEPHKEAAQPLPERRVAPLAIASVSAFLFGALLVGFSVWTFRPPIPEPPIARFAIPLGDGQRFGESGSRVLAISPDGTRVAFVVGNQLYLRSLSEPEAKPIAGTKFEQGQIRAPVFSPDGQWIAFVSSVPAHIRKVPVSGGAPITICDGCGPLGAMHWDRDGIVFAQGGEAFPVGFAGVRARDGTNRLMRVAAGGGEPERLLDVTEGTPWDPQMLPDGETILFTSVTNIFDLFGSLNSGVTSAEVVARSLKSGQRKVIINNGASARYVSTGHLLYAREGVLFARRFDLQRLETIGDEIPIVEGVRRAVFAGAPAAMPATYFDVSETGSLAFVPGPVTNTVRNDLALLDPRTGLQPFKLPPNPYEFPRVSPDGKWIAVGTNDGTAANIWVYDRSGASAIRQLTFMGKNRYPVWSPDSQFVTFQSDREGDLGLFRQRADGSGSVERLTKADSGTAHLPTSWSPDGNALLLEIVKDPGRTLAAYSRRDATITQVGDIGLPGRGQTIDATFSPDGRWLAYTGRSEGDFLLIVAPFPVTASTRFLMGNGMHSVWAHDGKTLFFRRPTTGEFFATHVTTEPAFSFGMPQQVPVSLPDRQSNSGSRNHDVTPDGKFIGVISVGQEPSVTAPQVNVVLNWIRELQARVPAR
jgi:serine/threonine-protein kinase